MHSVDFGKCTIDSKLLLDWAWNWGGGCGQRIHFPNVIATNKKIHRPLKLLFP